MKHFLVDVVCIASRLPRERFDPDSIERLADAILESDGLLKPLVLKATGPESFEVVDRHLEYWAAVRAREKDPRKGEMVNAYVVSPKSAESVARQLGELGRIEASAGGDRSVRREATPAAVGGSERSPAVEDFTALLLHVEEEVRRTLRSELDRRLSSLDAALPRLTLMVPRIERMEDGIERVLRSLEDALKKPTPTPRESKIPEEPFTQASLKKATVPVLKEIANQKGMSYGKLKKQEIIDALLKQQTAGW